MTGYATCLLERNDVAYRQAVSCEVGWTVIIERGVDLIQLVLLVTGSTKIACIHGGIVFTLDFKSFPLQIV